jgi:hypothetical protein
MKEFELSQGVFSQGTAAPTATGGFASIPNVPEVDPIQIDPPSSPKRAEPWWSDVTT